MLLCVIEFLAELADDVKFQRRVSRKPRAQRGHRHVKCGYRGYGRCRIHIFSFLGQPKQIIGEQEFGNVLAAVGRGPERLYDTAYDVEYRICPPTFTVYFSAFLEANDRCNGGEMRAFFLAEQLTMLSA